MEHKKIRSTADVPSIASGGELVALWAESYGVLDVTVVALIEADKRE